MSTALHENGHGRGRNAALLWLVLLLVTAAAAAAAALPAPTLDPDPEPEPKLKTKPEPHHLQIVGVEEPMSTLLVASQQQHQQQQQQPPATATTTATTMTPPQLKVMAVDGLNTTTTTTTTERPIKAINILSPVVHLLDLEQTVAPPIHSGHDGEKITRKKQLQQDNYPIIRPITTTTTTTATTTTTTIENEMERIPTSPTTSTTTSSTTLGTTSTTLKAKHNGYLGPIFMGEKTFSVLHPLKKPKQEANPNQAHQHVASIESQLRNGRIVEILAPTALLEQATQEATPPTATAPFSSASPSPSALSLSKLSTTVFQVAADTSTVSATVTSGLAAGDASEKPAAPKLPPRTESKISDIQIEVYDSTVDSIVASTNFRDNDGYYPVPALEAAETRASEAVVGTTTTTTKPLVQQSVIQERFTQYVIDRADVSTQPAAGVGKPVPAAIEIHINVSEAFGSESEDLEFSYRQPDKPSSKPSDEILVVEIIDNGDNNSTENSASGSGEHINPIFTFRSDTPVATPQVRPPQLPPDAQDELFMADLKTGGLDMGPNGMPRPPPPPPPPPPPRKPGAIDRDSDTIFYISNTEVKVGESLPTASSSVGNEQQQQQQRQRKIQLENQFFPANYMMERTSVATPRYEEDIILSPLHHNMADTLKIFRGNTGGGDGAPPLDVTYVGESVIEVEQQSPVTLQATTTMRPAPSSSSQLPDIIIQPAVLPDLAIGVPVIGELPPQIELKEIDYMPGELGLSASGIGIYENDIQGNALSLDMDSESEPDVIESSIQYGGDLIDDGAGGGFDGVEGSYPFDSPAHRMQQAVAPHNHHLHRENEPMAEMLNATLLQRNESGGGGGGGGNGGGASAMAPLLANGSQMPERMGNATALSEDPSNDFDGFLNLFAVSMGLIIVILPSALLVSMYCAVRYMLNKNTATGAQGDDSEQGQDLAKNESPSPSAASLSFPAAARTETPAGLSFIIDEEHSDHHQQVMAHCVQPIRFQFEKDSISATVIRDVLVSDVMMDQSMVIGPNGSITKMTLKDNHLIVVTEERHDISRNARETKMHTDKDGVFVVEVARGIDSKQIPPDSPGLLETTELPFDTKQQSTAAANGSLHALNEQSLPPSHEQVQIHAPPMDFGHSQSSAGTAIAPPVIVGAGGGGGGGTSSTPLHLIEEEEQQPNESEQEQEQEQEKIAQTGLSQSDLSSTSSADSNKRYTYGNQELYVIEQPGYVTTSPTAQPIIPNPSPPTEDATEVTNNNNEKEQEQKQKPETEPELEPKQNNGNGNELVEPEPKPEPELEPEPLTDLETLENIAVPPAAFDNYHPAADETEDNNKPELRQEDNTYDSLMSLPAPPSTEEIKELNDFTLIESNQLDSLPPPPPPPPPPTSVPTDANGNNGNGHAKCESDYETESAAIISNGNAGKVIASASASASASISVSVSVCVTQPNDEPTTLTPPASPPATPPPQPPATIFGGSGNGQLTNGIIHSMPVDVNGS